MALLLLIISTLAFLPISKFSAFCLHEGAIKSITLLICTVCKTLDHILHLSYLVVFCNIIWLLFRC